MPVSVRQSMLYAIVGIFLTGNLLLPAVLWRHWVSNPLALAASGPLVAEPMLLAVWLGLARQPIAQRLRATVGLGLAGSIAYVIGTWLSGTRLSGGVYLLFVISGLGAIILAGGFFRAHRFLVGVLTVEEEPAERERAQLQSAQPESAQPESAQLAAPGSATVAHESAPTADEARRIDSSPASPFDESLPPEAMYVAPPASRELQFGVGYMIAMTSAIAVIISVLRWLATTSQGPSWSIIFLFGWTFFVYSMLAAFLTVVSILSTRYPKVLKLLAMLYTLLAPLVTLPVLSVGGVDVTQSEHLISLYLYAFTLGLSLTVVTHILRRLGYRLRHGWL